MEIKESLAMTMEAFSKKKKSLCSKSLDLEIRKRLIKLYKLSCCMKVKHEAYVDDNEEEEGLD